MGVWATDLIDCLIDQLVWQFSTDCLFARLLGEVPK